MKRAVVDQAGTRVVLLGVVLSLFIGLIFKSQIRSSAVKSRLQQTLVKLQKDANIDFESVEVRLSEWGIPRPVIEIRGVRVSPLKVNCQENQIYIDNLSFPLSFNLLFSDDKVISSLRVSLLEVRTKNTRYCFSKSAARIQSEEKGDSKTGVTEEVAQSVTESVATSASPKNEALQKLQNFKSHLNEIKIDRLRLIAVDKMNTAVDFNAVQISFKYEKEKLNEFGVSGQLLAFKEADKSFYLLKSDLKFLLKVEDKISLNAELKGLVMDRPFQFKIRNNPQKNSLQFLGELNGISLKAMNYIIKTERPQTEVFDFLNNSSMTGFITGEYFLDGRNYEASIKDIKILLGGGAAEINDINIFGIIDDKAQVKPFDVQLSHIELTKILSNKAFDQIRPSIQNAGFISGLVQFTSVDQFKVKSLIEKTGFVFSNKGERVPQIFESFNLHATVDPQKLSLNINEFILDSQKIQGSVKYSHSYQSGEKSLNVDLQGHLLKPETVKLFTGMLGKPEIKLQFASDLKNHLKGSASIDQLNIHQFEMTNFQLDYERDLLLKNEVYNLKTTAFSIIQSEQKSTDHLNVLFDQLFKKPQVSFTQSKMNIQKDGLGKITFSLRADQKNKPDLNLTGDYNPEFLQLTARGTYKSQGFNLLGPIDNLQVIRSR